jgi:threonine-phosphate decarboxylase
MSQCEYKTQAQKYEFISGQHGGYYRHDFVDHAYLYNLYFPPKSVFDHFKNQINDLVLNYPVAQGDLADLVGKVINQPAERIVVGNGAAELIKIVSGHLAKKVIVPVPSFNEYANAAPQDQAIEFPLEAPSFELDIEKFAAEAQRSKADVAIVVTPNNPTSMIVPKADLIKLAQKLAADDCILIIDESFIDFAQDSDKFTLENELEDYPNMVIFKSMSKAYGICGLRIGYLLTANIAFAQAVRNGVHIWNINGFAEEFLRILPAYRNDFVQSCKKVMLDRDKLYEMLRAIEGMKVYKPDANYIFCRLPDSALSAPEFTRNLFIKHNMYIKHCQGKTLTDSDRYIRIASRTQLENCKLVEAIVKILATDERETLDG